jgi:CHAT domain-containing protein/Tfp pilus assembly protein PilF
MIPVLAAFPLLALASVQALQTVDSLRALAIHGSDSALVDGVRRSPMEARAAWRQLLATARGGEDSASLAVLTAAERLAGAVAVAWKDSFLVRQVARFRSLSPADRVATVEADSLWRGGRAAFGTAAAMGIFRESLRRFEALADTSGIAAVSIMLGIWFHEAQEYDSAAAYFTRAQDRAERIGNYYLLAATFVELGFSRFRQGDLPRAREFFTRAREIFERIGDAGNLRTVLNGFGLVAWKGGDLAEARRAFEAGLALSRSANDARDAALFLSNLGGVAAEAGDYAEASALLQEAISNYRAQERWLRVAALLRDLGAVALLRGDYPGAVRVLSEAAAIFRRMGPGAGTDEIDEITARSTLASARAAMGDLEGARAELERAEALARSLGGARGRASLTELARARGDLELKFNRLAEAERHYTRAHRLARGEAAEWTRSQAQVGVASVHMRRESYHRAQIILEQVLMQRSVSTHEAAMIRVLLGQAAWRRGETATARLAFGQALDTLRALGAVVDGADALGKLGDLEAQAGRPLAAESLYQRGLARLGARPAPEVAWGLHAGLAAALRSRGALADAAGELQAAIAEIERISGGLQLEEHRAAFRADKWDVYIDLALVERARGRTAAAFEASERLRARQMLDLLARGRVAEGGAGPGLASREQDLRRRMAELTQQLEVPPDTASDLRDPAHADAATEATRAALASAQEAYGALLLEMREANPSYAALVRGEIVSAPDVMRALAPDEALLEYLVGDSTTVVFVVTADSLAALDLKVSHNALTAQVDFARTTLARPREGNARRAWRPSLRRLYRQLVAPVEASELLAGKRRLLIAPHAELHYVPFAALVQPGPPEQVLVERYVIEYVPSASVWLRLAGRPGPPRRAGVLALAPRAGALPGSRAEVAAIGRIYGSGARVLVGPQATEQAFRTLAPDQGIVHLATYGVLNKHNPLFSFVELGAGSGQDGRLEVHEVFGLTFNVRLLVLSACQTGVGAGPLADVPPGDDWVGLVQGFLYAGASNVMATLWPVADVATARLMERFYGELAAGRPEAEALALAQRAAAHDAGTAHPFYWAGFTLVRGR